MNVVWFKRDLRLRDHAPLKAALESAGEHLLLYIHEPTVWAHPAYSDRHWRFVREGLDDMNAQLDPLGASIFEWTGDPAKLFADWAASGELHAVYSYLETGLQVTFDRDLQVAAMLRNNGVPWHEFQQNGVQRGRKNRKGWRSDWYAFMGAAQDAPDWSRFRPAVGFASPPEHPARPSSSTQLSPPEQRMQPGGERKAHAYLRSFVEERVADYSRSISKPAASRTGCSRLSPYIAWGNLSIRQVYQAQSVASGQRGYKRQFRAFSDRLRWHCHFIQKFEMEDAMEFRDVNRGYEALEKPLNPDLVSAWKSGQTGFPLIDACMRCLAATGYINFRMRAMLVSFLTHHLWQPWQAGVEHLAGLFLDFEPGIHYPQFQMQAGVTGINTVRIYNPVKQAEDHDADGRFIKQWVPELEALDPPHVYAPWKLPPMEAVMLGFELGRDYPKPVVDLERAARRAREALYRHRAQPAVQREAMRILARHTIPGGRMA